MISKTIGFRGLAYFQTNPYFCQMMICDDLTETELWKAAQKLPNPRKLLSLEAHGRSSGVGAVVVMMVPNQELCGKLVNPMINHPK